MEIRGKYKIINKIGAGQFGTIFKAKNMKIVLMDYLSMELLY